MSPHPGSFDADRNQDDELSFCLTSATSDSTVQRCDLRLVIVTHFYPTHGGGIEFVAGKLVEEFARRGVQVCWFSSDTDDPPRAAAEGVNYVPIGTSNVIVRNGRTQSLRPERLRLLGAGSEAPEGSNAESGTVTDVIYLGMMTRIYVHLDSADDIVVVRTNDDNAGGATAVETGSHVVVAWRPEDAFALASELV